MTDFQCNTRAVCRMFSVDDQVNVQCFQFHVRLSENLSINNFHLPTFAENMFRIVKRCDFC